MDKKIVGLLGAVAGLATVVSAEAATAPAANQAEALRASSYADLLAPIPNAVELVRADDAAQAQASQPASREGVQPVAGFSVQFGYPYGYAYPYRRYHHHHHHHHHIRVLSEVIAGAWRVRNYSARSFFALARAAPRIRR